MMRWLRETWELIPACVGLGGALHLLGAPSWAPPVGGAVLGLGWRWIASALGRSAR